jgi:hypothetical protein
MRRDEMPSIRTEEELLPLTDQYCDLPTTDINIDLEQIIYRKLVINTSNPDNSTYENIYINRYYPAGAFAALITDIARHGYSSLRFDKPEIHPLDIPVARDSVIIVQLPPDGGHKFIAPAIFLRKVAGQCRTDLYGGLRYVDDQGNASTVPPENCKLIYFFAMFQPDTPAGPYIQPFLYNPFPARIRLTVIDPDIRYPGVGGNTAEP